MYSPARHGVPSYFLPMQDDADRNTKYEVAIQNAIAEFRRDEGRHPVVVDFGCGTGMLSMFALRHGAKHVIAVDVNADMADMCEHVLETAGFPSDCFTVVCGTIKKERPPWLPPFDLVVSEILGTTGTSECMFEFLGDVLRHARTDLKRVYCIPESLSVTCSWYNAQEMFASELEQNLPLKTTLSGIEYWDGEAPYRPDMRDTKDGLLLHHMDCQLISTPHTITSESYFSVPPKRSASLVDMSFALHCPPDEKTVFVIEWTACLWGQVTLSNTLQELSKLPPRNSATRTLAWGLMYSRPFAEQLQKKSQIGARIYKWSKGVPLFTFF